MELEYVAKAVRRFWPVVLLSFVLGIIAGQLLQPSTPPRYESAALLLVTPDSELGNTEGDRYVASQLVVLESPPLAAHAEELAGVSLADGGATVAFNQITGTDVVRVIASSDSPADSQLLANAFLDAYVERTGETSGADKRLDTTEIEASLGEIEGQLGEVDPRIAEVMAPFLESADEASDAAIPEVEQVAPALATEREVLMETYRGLLSQRTNLEFQPVAPNSQIIPRAALPTDPLVKSSLMMAVALPILGLLFGIGAATVLARSSRRVLDGAEVVDRLDLPFATALPAEKMLRARSLFQLHALPDEYEAGVNELCVQLEARGRLDTPLTVLVTGSQRVSGSTTLAGAMAARFGALGRSRPRRSRLRSAGPLEVLRRARRRHLGAHQRRAAGRRGLHVDPVGERDRGRPRARLDAGATATFRVLVPARCSG